MNKMRLMLVWESLPIVLIAIGLTVLLHSKPVHVNVKAAGNVFYLDCVTGNDTAAGTSETTAWKSLTKVNTLNLQPGDKLLLKQDCSWTGSLQAKWNGTSTQPITIASYGSGEKPLIKSNITSTHPINITGSYIVIDAIQTSADAPSVESGCENVPVGYIIGFYFANGSHHVTVQNSKASHLQAGVDIREGSHHNRILNSIFENNIMMSRVDNTNPDNDSGAFGIALHGDDNEIAFNTISGSNACSYDYGRDGSAVEVYGGQRNVIHHNRAINNVAFTELGNPRSADNIYAYNFVTSDLNKSVFLNTRGGGNFGPVLRTKVYNNVAYITGAQGEGVVCSYCGQDILTLKNNILWGNWKSIYASGSFDEANNMYWKTGGNPLLQFQNGAVMSSTSKKADPLFVNIETGDFHLQPGSAAINAGAYESVAQGFNTDLDSNAVPQGTGVDIGVDETGGTIVTLTPTPTTPAVTQPPDQTYTFTAVGDTGADYDAREVFKKISQSGGAFFIHLGDMMYGHLASEPNPEQAWCDFVKTYVGANLPVELVTGNHEDMDNGSENYGRQVSKILPCLPNRIKNTNGQDAIVGKYGYEYYFDYPVQNPLARHIQIAPFIMDETGDRYSYEANTKHYNFVKNAIDDARAKGIRWIIVSMHHTCISVNGVGCVSPRDPKSNMIDLYNMLIEKKVDLLIHGHVHNYNRSKQLGLSTNCPRIVSGSGTNPTATYNSSCVVDQGTNGTFTKDKGTVITVVGTGGIGIDVANPGSTSNYFVTWLGKPGAGDTTHGFGKFTVSAHELTYSFESASWEYKGKIFNDSFKIRAASSGVTPTLTPTGAVPTSTPTVSPTVSPGCALKSKGDADCNGKIDLADFEIWRREYTGNATTKGGDFDANSIVNLVDFEIWRRNFLGAG